ncbi:unnamed protein product [Phytophthora lilii]|uniref:Unnamed protein product n=1 Tax=Phytophthora lilii TaxID=2077276 RepID=A0A9W6UB91_9STRA|nr:unnamed protein product [Phytophthora lilii]
MIGVSIDSQSCKCQNETGEHTTSWGQSPTKHVDNTHPNCKDLDPEKYEMERRHNSLEQLTLATTRNETAENNTQYQPVTPILSIPPALFGRNNESIAYTLPMIPVK